MNPTIEYLSKLEKGAYAVIVASAHSHEEAISMVERLNAQYEELGN